MGRCFFFFQAEDGIRDSPVTGVQTCALPIFPSVSGKTKETKTNKIRLVRRSLHLLKDTFKSLKKTILNASIMDYQG